MHHTTKRQTSACVFRTSAAYFFGGFFFASWAVYLSCQVRPEQKTADDPSAASAGIAAPPAGTDGASAPSGLKRPLEEGGADADSKNFGARQDSTLASGRILAKHFQVAGASPQGIFSAVS